MRVVLQAVLLAASLTCSACKSDADDAPADDGAKHTDAGGKRDASMRGGNKPGSGLFDRDGRVLEFDDAGQPIEHDAAAPIDASNDAGPIASGGDGGPVQQPTFEVPSDPGARGPWAVGVRTLQVDLGSGRHIPAEVWYPAEAQSEVGKQLQTYDLADWLPPEAHDMLPSDELPIPVPCNCYRDLPIDTEHGRYPVSVVVHALGGSRLEAVALAAHWASRGFIVIAADHPQLVLADTWAAVSTCTGSTISEDTNRDRDVPAELRALRDGKAEWEFLAGRADLSKVAVSGQVLGADFAAAMNGEPGVRLLMLWNSSISGVAQGDLASVVYVTGQESSYYTDSYATVKSAFNTTSASLKPTILVGVANAASQSITPYCSAKSPQGLDGEHLQAKYQLCGISFGNVLSRSDCKPEYLTQAQADAIFGYVTTAALEETLKGKDPNVAWGGFKAEWGELLQAR